MTVVFGDKLLHGKWVDEIQSKPTFVAMDFPLPRRETTWNKFPSKMFFQVENTSPYEKKKSTPLPKPISRRDTPDFPTWKSSIDKVKKGGNEKVVLCRKTSFKFDRTIDPFPILDLLIETAKSAQIFGIILDKNLAFIGATPELLIKRRQRLLQTEALAGTKLLNEEDKLLASEKDKKEFSIVKNTLGKKLSSIAKPFTIDDNIFIKRTSKVCHLHYPFEVTLKKSISDLELINLLHPTPAIGGFPKESSLKTINELERFDRGLYAGTIGMISEEDSEVYVAIRSALIDGNQIHLFAGAGIMNDSVAEFEWQELENKISQFGVS